MRLLTLLAVGLIGFSVPSARAEPVEITPQMESDFERWKMNFRAEAISDGVPAHIFDNAFAGVTLNGRVIELDRKQPEFSRPIWKYLEGAVSETRVDNGKDKRADLGPLLARIEQTYRVNAEVVLAIWGLESAYGSFYGDYSVVRSLATLAFEGRRKKFAENQLYAVLRILENGDIAPDQLKGSWAGAMGHTQFIPTSFETFAVDFSGDGRRDFWGPPDDALGSAANYLAKSGWRYGEPAYAIVRLPQGIDYFDLNASNKQDTRSWAAQGVTLADGRPLPDLGSAAIVLPAGARGPAIMTFHNFGVIRKHNNATAYALGVSHLAERIMGAPRLTVLWPEDDRPLGRTEKKTLQERLTALGFDTGGIDGVLGPNSRGAIRKFQRTQGQPADGYASEQLLRRVEAAAKGIPVTAMPEPMATDTAAPAAQPNPNYEAGGQQFAPVVILWIQEALNARGFIAGEADGVMGANTRGAISDFQRAYGFPMTGEPSVQLIEALGGRVR